jgi:hypothetical protein
MLLLGWGVWLEIIRPHRKISAGAPLPHTAEKQPPLAPVWGETAGDAFTIFGFWKQASRCHRTASKIYSLNYAAQTKIASRLHVISQRELFAVVSPTAGSSFI